MQRAYKELLKSDDFKRDMQLINIISELICCNNLKHDKKLIKKITLLTSMISDHTADDTDVVNYNTWLKSKI